MREAINNLNDNCYKKSFEDFIDKINSGEEIDLDELFRYNYLTSSKEYQKYEPVEVPTFVDNKEPQCDDDCLDEFEINAELYVLQLKAFVFDAMQCKKVKNSQAFLDFLDELNAISVAY